MPGTPTNWIEYSDGEMPPDPEATVVVRFRDGLQGKARRAGLWRWTWESPSSNDDITAYLVLSFNEPV